MRWSRHVKTKMIYYLENEAIDSICACFVNARVPQTADTFFIFIRTYYLLKIPVRKTNCFSLRLDAD